MNPLVQVEPGLYIWTIFVFLLLLVAFNYLAWKPLKATLAAREDSIRKSLDDARQAREELQRLCDLYEIGIEVQQLVLQDVNPPDPVKPAFNEVNQAIQEKERAINDAWAEYNRSVPLAKGQAEQMIRAAEGYATERVNNAQGDAARFEAVLTEYQRAPQVTRRRLYLEAMSGILPKAGRRIVVDDKARAVLPLLNLGGPGGSGSPGGRRLAAIPS